MFIYGVFVIFGGNQHQNAVFEQKRGLDYYPFGMIMAGRIYVADSTRGYRYGFNGMEQDDEMKGSGNSYDFGARMYDSRLGRWWSVDPLAYRFAYSSTYAFVENSTIVFIDPDGRKIWIYDSNSKEAVLYVPNATILNAEVSDFVRQTAATLDGIMSSGMDDKFKIVETLAQDNSYNLIEEIAWDEQQGGTIGIISWSPQGGIVTDEGDRQTPAEGLLHELAHNYYELYDPTGEVSRRPSPLTEPYKYLEYLDQQTREAAEYDTPSDEWIINEVEGGAGGAKRKAHSFKEPYKADNPFSVEGPAKSELEAND